MVKQTIGFNWGAAGGSLQPVARDSALRMLGRCGLRSAPSLRRCTTGAPLRLSLLSLVLLAVHAMCSHGLGPLCATAVQAPAALCGPGCG